MSATIPFFFQAKVVLADSPAQTGRTFVSSVAVDIPEVTADEAPVVLAIRELDNPRAAPEGISYRHFGGDFYVESPLGTSFVSVISTREATDGLRILMASFVREGAKRYWGTPSHNQLSEAAALWAARGEHADGDVIGTPGETVEKWLESDRTAAGDAAAAIAGQFLIVDGICWTRVDEPRFAVEVEVNRGRAILVHEPLAENRRHLDRNGNRSHMRVLFSPTETSHIQAWFDRDDQTRSRSFDAMYLVDVIDPTVFAVDSARDVAVRAAVSFVHYFPEIMPSKSRDFVNAWMDIRDCVADEPDADAQREIARLITGAADEIGHSQYRAAILGMVEIWKGLSAGRAPSERHASPSPAP